MQDVFTLVPEDTISPPILAWRRRWVAESQSAVPRATAHYALQVRGAELHAALRRLAGDQPDRRLHLAEAQDSDGESHIYLLWDQGLCTLSLFTPPREWNPCDPRRMKIALKRPEARASIECFTPASETTQAVVDLLKAHRWDRPRRSATVGLIVANHGHLHIDDMALSGSHRLVRSNYAPRVLEAFDRLRDFARWRTPSEAGNLVLIDGPPGVGKTSLIRALIAGTPAPYVLAAGATIGSLEDPNFLPFILTQAQARRGLVLLLEDADSVILKREFTQDLGLLSSLLNATSGILGDLTKLRVIATVNTWNDERVDDAVTRPGRLFQRISLGELPAEQARSLVLRESGSELAAARVTEPMTLAAAYELARAHTAKPARSKRAQPHPLGLRIVPKSGLGDDFEEV